MARRLTLVALPNAVGIARHFTTVTLQGLLQTIVDNAELVVSELVTNSVEAGGLTMETPAGEISSRHLVTLALAVSPTHLYIEVTDLAPGGPTPRCQDDDAESGRGLFLVEAFCERWGVTPHQPIGKTVWCVLSLRPLAPADAAERTTPLPVQAPVLPRRTSLRHRDDVPPLLPNARPWKSPLPTEGIKKLLEGLARL
ncbi:ATP-binding protein [Nocardiopsis sp. FR4]|uniref:ATP-binding protein n=1 Tax=Nocardiopsis sp. FR4 TaxID=2605985 RepID=UPI001F16FA11|nr:ATP-binding protein [Nocardiopsis sp. FR4]